MDISRGTGYDRTLARLGPDGKLLETFVLRLDQEPRHVELLGVDRSGAIYMGVDLGTSAGVIRKYDRSGRFVWQVAAPQQEDVYTNTWARVDPDGSVYLFKLNRDGVQIEKWERMVNWSLLP